MKIQSSLIKNYKIQLNALEMLKIQVFKINHTFGEIPLKEK